MFKNMFGSNNQGASTAGQQQPPAVGAKDQIKPNGMNPNDPATAGVANPDNPDSGKSPVNPLDVFKDLYKIDSSKEGTTPEKPRLDIPDEVFAKVLPSLDFTAGLTPEVRQQIDAGDGKAILAAMQQVGAEAYKTALQHNSAVLNDHLDKRFDAFTPTIKQNVDNNLTSSALASLPNADNPVIKAELDRVSSQLRNKFPDAPNQWIVEQTNTYLMELGKQLSPPTAEEVAAQALPKSVDFAELLREDS